MLGMSPASSPRTPEEVTFKRELILRNLQVSYYTILLVCHLSLIYSQFHSNFHFSYTL